MRLELEEFLVTFDPARVSVSTLLATIKAAGYTAQIVGDKSAAPAVPLTVLPAGFALLDEAVARAKAENKLLVLDFSAAWCAPCQQMEKTTFRAEAVTALLQRCVLLKVDTDAQPELTQAFGVVGLPDLRLATPAGRIVRQLRGFLTAEALAAELTTAIRALGQD